MAFSETHFDYFRYIDRAMRAARGRRRVRAAAENRALHQLAECMSGEPLDVLRGLLSLAAELVGGGAATCTAGVSFTENARSGEQQFRSVAMVGRLAASVGEVTPRHHSPCGECLARREPIVLGRLDLKYTYFLDTGVEFTEGLIVPFVGSSDAEPLGTIWVVSHPPKRHSFDDEDVRMMASLANFASMAYRVAKARDVAERERGVRVAIGAIDVAMIEDGVVGHLPATFESGLLKRQRDIAERMLVSALREQAQSDENAELYHSADSARVLAEKAKSNAETSRTLAERAQHQAEAANSAKAQLLAAMSHELRTPLNAIAGHTQLLGMGIHGPVTEAQRETLGRIDRAQRYLLRLVNDVLNLERLRAERVAYAVEPLRLAEVVADLDALISPQILEKGLKYSVDVPSDCVVLGDREKIIQILLNLLSNAVKFTSRGGSVMVECVRRADGSGDPTLINVRVRDTGLGIATDKLEQIFEPFVQVDTTAAGRAAGAGLGLAISRDLARGMGGDLRARSTLGVGSTLTLQLRAVQ
ncbi:MAG: ATP-binding protein [Gemmatimonadaceae bacterium]